MGGNNLIREAAVSPSDDELLATARQGDSRALETLLVRYQPHLYRFGLRMCGNVEDAGDVVQESLLSMARSLGTFRGDASVSSWLYTIARRVCLKKRRRGKFAPAQEVPLDAADSDAARRLADPAPSPEQMASHEEIDTALTRAIDELDRPQREVMLLRDVEELSAREVAQVLGISVDAVKSRLHRARVAVRERLAPLLGSESSVRSTGASQCPDVLTLLSRHLEGDIDPAVCAKLETHLERCRRCRAACDSLKRTLAACRQLPTPQVPAALAASIRTALKSFLNER